MVNPYNGGMKVINSQTKKQYIFFKKLRMYKPVVNFGYEKKVIFFYHEIRRGVKSDVYIGIPIMN